MDYIYYHFKTGSLAETRSTAEIAAFLQGFSFLQQSGGEYASQQPFLSISLLHVKSYDSWNAGDYDPLQTNYIPIVTSTGFIADARVQTVLSGLAHLLQTDICEDW